METEEVVEENDCLFWSLWLTRNHIIISDPTLCNTKAETIVCERCGKARKYPSYINKKYLNKHWFCEFDVWNKKQISCECDTEKVKHEEDKAEEPSVPRVKIITPAIWGGETVKTVFISVSPQ